MPLPDNYEDFEDPGEVDPETGEPYLRRKVVPQHGSAADPYIDEETGLATAPMVVGGLNDGHEHIMENVGLIGRALLSGISLQGDPLEDPGGVITTGPVLRVRVMPPLKLRKVFVDTLSSDPEAGTVRNELSIDINQLKSLLGLT